MTCPAECYVRAIVAYDGTDFCGFQIQGGHQARQSDCDAEPAQRTDVRCPRTVQGVLEESLAQVTREHIRLVGAGRTDAGVHALGQVVAFTTHWRHTLPDLRRAWNANLPDDVAILNLGQAPQGFHCRFDATSRAYRYTILNHPMRNPLLRRTALWVPQSLDVASMGAALELLVGEHDFATFGAAPGRRRKRHAGTRRTESVRSTVRRVLRATVEEGLLTATAIGRSQPMMARTGTVDADGLGSAGHPENGCCYRAVYVDIEANAFLYRMVRSIVGTILQVGRGQLSVAQFASLFAAADRGQAGPTAPPHGLCLVAVNY